MRHSSKISIVSLLSVTLLGAAFQEPSLPLQPVPTPDLSAMAEPVRREIERLESIVERLATEGNLPAAELGRTYTMLGEIFEAHGLSDAATIAHFNARQINPEDTLPVFHLGRIYRESGAWDEAEAAFSQVLALDPDDHTARTLLGEVQLDRQNVEGAEHSFRLVLTQQKDSAAAHFGLGRALLSRGETEEAIRSFESALAIQPDAALVHYSLALAYRKLRNLEAARRHLDLWSEEPARIDDPRLDRLSRIAALSAVGATLALASDSAGFSAGDFLGFAVDQLGETRGAIELLQAAATAKELDEDENARVEAARIHFAIGGLLVFKGEETAAIQHFRSATGHQPDFLEAHVELGDVLARTGDFAGARAAYDRALSLDPGNPATLLHRATVLTRMADYSAAISDLENVTSLQPEDPDGWLHLAAASESLSDSPRAISAYEEVLRLSPSSAEGAFAHQRLGSLLRSQGDLKAALEHYEEALRSEGGPVEVRFDMASVLARLERYDDAAREYSRVIDEQPRHEAARLAEASALMLAGRWAQAGQRLEEGHNTLPDSWNLSHLLARFLAAAPDNSMRDGPRSLSLVEPLFSSRRSLFAGETAAMALAESGRFQEACTLQQSILEAARQANLGSSTLRLERNLELYLKDTACCAESEAIDILPPLEDPSSTGFEK
jgi:tetratricopeptide (TPR) repeat protein